jgi:hypothetical protein
VTTSFVDIVSVPVTGVSIPVNTPDSVKIGDLIYVIALCDAAATITLPDATWKPHTPFVVDTLNGLTSFQYADEDGSQSLTFTLSVFTAPRYLFLLVYRGTTRDFAFNNILYPYGFFAPAGSVGATVTGVSQIMTSQNPPNPTTIPDFARALYFFVQHDSLLGSPSIDDVVPLEPIRSRVQTTSFGIEVIDVEYPDPVSPAPVLSVGSSLNKPWTVFSVVFEALEPFLGARDNYKSKLLRGMWPPPYNSRLSSNLGKLLTVIGTSDNDLGGLFGVEDFLPDEEP